MSGKCRKIISMLILTALLSMLLLSLYGCTKTPEDYTLDEHMKNISKRIEEKYLQDGETYNVYPVYTQNDVLKYFLVEFSTDRCIFIMVRETDFEFRLLNGKYSIYACAYDFNWYRYRLEENLDKSVYGNPIMWSSEKTNGAYLSIGNAVYCEVDDSGEQINYYNNSPYNVANVLDKKLFLFEFDNNNNYWYVPAIEICENTYINLVSMAEFSTESDLAEQERMGIPFVLDPHAHF